MPIHRLSSRRTDLASRLNQHLAHTRRYLRIAGYFRASLLEIAGEALAGVPETRIVCNADLAPHDLTVARAVVARWQAEADGLEALLLRERYRRLHDLLSSGRLRVRVVSTTTLAFLHGKAGVLEFHDGGSLAFVGSVNDSRNAWRHNYEILWEDEHPDACAWVREEFDFFWERGVDLPDAVIEHIGTVAHRVEHRDIAEWRETGADPAPALVERPLYRTGNLLRPWQKRFVQTCLEQQRRHGKARLLIADDVGLGKTLSLGAATLVLSLLGDRPVLILAPATLVWQWQVELADMLGLPACVWSTRQKCWLDPAGFPLSGRGVAHITRCPMRIGIVSTGLVVNGSTDGERGLLEQLRFGVLVLDEAHKARARRDRNGEISGRNNLMDFMHRAAARAEHVLLGTATPIQLHARELWDLVHLLSQGAPQVLGLPGSPWLRDDIMERFTEDALPEDPVVRWELLKNPLAPASEDSFYRGIRADADLPEAAFMGPRFDDLSPGARDDLRHDFPRLFADTNPIIRHTIRRSRQLLEERGLLRPIAVTVHPRAGELPADWLEGQALRMGLAFEHAYDNALAFCREYASHRPAAGFMKTILLRRLGSSLQAGLNTASALLQRGESGLGDEAEVEDELLPDAAPLNATEQDLLCAVCDSLAGLLAQTDADPKANAVIHYLREHDWLGVGAVIFSQYVDTAEWLAGMLRRAFPGEPLALYAGGGRSVVYRGEDRRHAEREAIKQAVQRGEIRLLVATDAACEGLNLQRLGAQINIDLPWNPARLEQRKGRVQRIGQRLDTIRVMNLRYAGTVEDEVYAALSARFQDIFQVLGQLPDSFEEAWVEAALQDRAAVRHVLNRVDLVRTPMERRYFRDVADDSGLDWERCERIIAAHDIQVAMRRPWP